VTGAAAASEAYVAHAVLEALKRGNAADAVVTGVFVAAAVHPAVLLGPFQLLAGGGGVGPLALDGRLRQPGLGVPRPRGFVPAEPVPGAARVAVPTLPAALAASLGALGHFTLRRALGPAIEHAVGVSTARAEVLEALARRGPTALWDHPLAGELFDVAGRANGGLLTREDLATVRPALVRCQVGGRGPSTLRTPWTEGDSPDSSFVQVLAAADAKGMVVIGCYENALEGLAIPALGLVAPSRAHPVMRGKRRLQPGVALPSASPIALHWSGGRVDLALGVARDSEAERRLRRALASDDAGLLAIQTARADAGDGCLVAVARTRDAVRVLASA
jgi:gamma-glutamyltranspeptidase/glutathione hydrolase